MHSYSEKFSLIHIKNKEVIVENDYFEIMKKSRTSQLSKIIFILQKHFFSVHSKLETSILNEIFYQLKYLFHDVISTDAS